MLPHNVPFTLLGAGLLWFGWFGFNGGSALAANKAAALAFVNTFLAPAATLVVWSLLDLFRNRKATAVGAATGIVVGLVAITPAAGLVSPLSAMALGAVAAFPSYFAIVWRARTRLDDSLDVVSAHGLGGLVGALLTGVLAQASWGLPRTGSSSATRVSSSYSSSPASRPSPGAAGVTFVLLKAIGAVRPLKATAGEEGIGLDFSQHGEEAYTTGEGALLLLRESVPVSPRAAATPAVPSEVRS